jgi:glyoxylate utilization-related uncharacterized protein
MPSPVAQLKLVRSMWRTAFFAFIASSATMSGQPAATAVPDDVAKLRWLDHADVKADFQRAVERNDFRFLESLELGGVIPSVVTPYDEVLMYNHGHRLLEGTGCVPSCEEARRLNLKALEYASKYNELLLDYLRKHPKT